MNSLSEILKPSLTKINTAIFLFVIFGYMVWPLLLPLFGGDDIMLGFPMPIRRVVLSSDGVNLAEPFNVLNIAIDFCFWYLIGAGYVWYKDSSKLEVENE